MDESTQSVDHPDYWTGVLEAARKLPEFEESTSYGTPAIKVRGRLVARLWEDGETLVVKVDFYERQMYLDANPDVYYITDHYRDYPAMLIHLSKIQADELAERLEDAWLMMAPKQLRSKFEAAS